MVTDLIVATLPAIDCSPVILAALVNTYTARSLLLCQKCLRYKQFFNVTHAISTSTITVLKHLPACWQKYLTTASTYTHIEVRWVPQSLTSRAWLWLCNQAEALSDNRDVHFRVNHIALALLFLVGAVYVISSCLVHINVVIFLDSSRSVTSNTTLRQLWIFRLTVSNESFGG